MALIQGLMMRLILSTGRIAERLGGKQNII